MTVRRLVAGASYRISGMLIASLLVCPRALAADSTPSAAGEVLDDAAASVQSGLKTEAIKTGMAGLVQTARLSNPTTADEAAKEVAEAVQRLEMAIRGPSRVALGEWATFYLEAAGGIPLYCGVPDGPCGDTAATAYWRANGKLGKRTVKFQLKDDLGRAAAKKLEIELVSAENSAADSGRNTDLSAGGSGQPGVAEDWSKTPLCKRARACCDKQMDSQPDAVPEKVELYCRINTRLRASCEWWNKQAACK